MKSQTFLFFATPITMINFGPDADELNQDLVKDILFEKENSKSASRSAINGWQSEGNMEQRHSSFFSLRAYVGTVIESVMPDLGFLEPEKYKERYICNEFWANVLDTPGAFHIPHIHGTGETIFAGVYYPTDFAPAVDLPVETDHRASSVPEPGDLMLFDPASTEKRAVINQNLVNRYPYYGHEVCIRPRKGNLIIFPSYLSHMVAPLTTNDTRISISFSYSKRP